MDTAIISVLIGTLGTGTVALLVFIFTGLRTAILDNSTRIGGLEKGFARLEERMISEFRQITDVLTRIEATQAEQARQIEKLSGGDLP